MTDTVEFLGAEFRVNGRVGVMPMMRYARVAKRQMERQRNGGESDGTDEVEIFDATLSLLEQCVHPEDWSRFERHSETEGASHEELMEFAGKVMARLVDRPTTRPSDSSGGPQTTEPSSTGGSSSPAGRVIDRLNEKGRPDLALLVRRREESLAG